MRQAVAVRRMPLLRAALVGSGLAAAWVVVSLVASPSSASAEERPDGLLGTLGSVVGVVDGTLDAVVDDVVAPVVGAVAPTAVETVEQVAPAPVQPDVHAVPVIVDQATDVAGRTIDAVDTVLVETASELGATVGEVAGSAPVGRVVDPLLGVVDGVIGSLPAIGPVLGDPTLGGLLGPVVDVVDDSLDVVVGGLPALPGDGVLPGLPSQPGPGVGLDPVPSAPALPDPGAPVAAVVETVAAVGSPPTTGTWAESDTGSSAAATPPAGAILPTSTAPAAGDGSPLGSSAPPGSSASAGPGAGLGSGSDAAALAAHLLGAHASLVLASVDDELPSSPVFETDTTPD